MPTNTVTNLYRQLTQIIKEFDEGTITAQQVKQTISFSEQFIAAFRQFPDILVAQPLLYKSQLPFEVNLCFSGCVYTAVLCNQNNVNVTCAVQMLGAIISLYSLQQKAVKQHYLDQAKRIQIKRSKRFIELLNKSNQQVWLRGYELLDTIFKYNKALPGNWPLGLSKIQRLIFLAHTLAVQLTPNNRFTVQSFANALRNIVQQVPTDWLEDIEPLMHYPGLICPGTFVKSDGKSKLVLSVGSNKLLVCGLSANTQNKLPYSRIYHTNIQRISPPQKISSFSPMAQWWGDDWSNELPVEPIINPVVNPFKLDKPPAILLEVQNHLSSHDINIDKLAVMISEEPAFAEYVKTSATFSNRHKLPVQQVKHGLMMHGYERTNHMLIQQALLLRLNQSYFPLQQEFIQFTRLRAQIAELLAPYAEQVSVEQVSTLTCFACSGLFTQNPLKGRRHWLLKQASQQDIQSLFLFSGAKNLLQHSITLAQAWHQPKADIQALQYHFLMPDNITAKRPVKQLAVILGLSLIKARQSYFAEPILCEETQTYVNQGLKFLHITAQEFEPMGLLAMSQNHSYCALN